MSYLQTIIYFLVFSWLIYKWKFFHTGSFASKAFVGIYFLKCLSGLVLYFIYTVYYPDRLSSDSFRYFDDAVIMYDVLKSNPGDYFSMLFGINDDSAYFEKYYYQMYSWYKYYDYTAYNDTRIAVRLNAFIMLFSFKNYHVHTLIFNFIGLTGLTAIYKTVISVFNKNKLSVLLAVFFLPSVMFWGSGVLKEPIMLLGLGLILYSFLKLNTGYKIKWIVIFLFGFYILLLSKVYVLLILIPAMIAYLIVKKFNRPVLVYSLVYFGGLLSLFVIEKINPGIKPVSEIVQKQNDFINVANMFNAGSKIEIEKLSPTLFSFLTTAPGAAFNTIARPFPTDINNPLMILSFLENLLILTLVIFCIFNFKKPEKSQLNLICLMLFFSLGMAVLIGWVTPIIGAMVRYKIAFFPLLISVVVCCTNFDKLLAILLKLNFVKKIFSNE